MRWEDLGILNTNFYQGITCWKHTFIIHHPYFRFCTWPKLLLGCWLFFFDFVWFWKQCMSKGTNYRNCWWIADDFYLILFDLKSNVWHCVRNSAKLIVERNVVRIVIVRDLDLSNHPIRIENWLIWPIIMPEYWYSTGLSCPPPDWLDLGRLEKSGP